jgi:hypothetical protein
MRYFNLILSVKRVLDHYALGIALTWYLSDKFGHALHFACE